MSTGSWIVVGSIASVGILITAVIRIFGDYDLIRWMLPGGIADLDTSYRVRRNKNANWITVQNRPDASERARILDIMVQAKNERSNPLHASEVSDKLPAVLEPGQEIKFLASHHKQCGPPHDVEVTWKDDSGNKHTLEKTVYR